MRPLFIPKGVTSMPPKEDGPYLKAVSMEVIFYDDGTELQVLDNYEGSFEMILETGVKMDRVKELLVMFAGSQVIVNHQIMRVRARVSAGICPPGRYEVVRQTEEEVDDVGTDSD